MKTLGHVHWVMKKNPKLSSSEEYYSLTDVQEIAEVYSLDNLNKQEEAFVSKQFLSVVFILLLGLHITPSIFHLLSPHVHPFVILVMTTFLMSLPIRFIEGHKLKQTIKNRKEYLESKYGNSSFS